MTKRRLLIPVLATAVAVAVLVGCGGGGSSSSTDPASVAPPGSPLFVEGTVRPGGSLKSDVDSLAQQIAGIDNLGEKIVTELEASASASGEPFDYAKEVEPWLGERAGVSFQKFDGSDFSDFAVAVQSTDTEATQSFIDKQVASGDEPTEKGSYQGNDYEIETEDGMTIGVVDEFLVVGQDEQAFKDAVDASEGESLSEVDSYTSTVSQAPSGSLLDAYVDIGALIQQSGNEIDQQAQESLKAAGITLEEATAVASLVPGSDTIEIDLSSDVSDGTTVQPATDLLGSLPAGSFVALAGSEVGKHLEEGLDSLDEQGVPGQLEPHQLKKSLKAVGIDLDEFTGSIEDAGVFAVGNSQNSLGGALILTTKSGSQATNTISNLGLLLRSAHTPGVTAIGGEASGFSIRSKELGPKPLVIAAKGDRIAIGYGLPATQQGLAAKSSATLASTPAYKEAVTALGGTPISGFVDGPSALGLAEALVPKSETGFQEATPYLKKIGYVAIGAGSDGGHATAKLIVGLGK